jgi:hypothetical protein
VDEQWNIQFETINGESVRNGHVITVEWGGIGGIEEVLYKNSMDTLFFSRLQQPNIAPSRRHKKALV